jgi:hypothetical protein
MTKKSRLPPINGYNSSWAQVNKCTNRYPCTLCTGTHNKVKKHQNCPIDYYMMPKNTKIHRGARQPIAGVTQIPMAYMYATSAVRTTTHNIDTSNISNLETERADTTSQHKITDITAKTSSRDQTPPPADTRQDSRNFEQTPSSMQDVSAI